jgi:hypothetical protein
MALTASDRTVMCMNQQDLKRRMGWLAPAPVPWICGLLAAGGLFWGCSGTSNPVGYWVNTPHGQGQPPDTFVPANDPAKRFIGKGPGDLFKELGPPSQTIPFPPTGGKMFIYAEPGKPHYVFETNGLNRIDRAATVQ